MSMKIAIGSMMHETNTFTKEKTPIDRFTIARDDVFDDERWTKSPTGGIIHTLLENRATVIPTYFARAIPSGVVERQAYGQMKNGILDKIRNTPDIDGVCLALHGSMAAEDTPDPEGDLLAELRDAIGPDIPIVCALDMHATVTEKMAKACNGFTVYRTAPHVDGYETGQRAASLLCDILRHDRSTFVTLIKLPMLLAGEQSESDQPPMKDLITLAVEQEKDPRILNADYTLGFPWADSVHNGIGVVVTACKKDQKSASGCAKKMAHTFWDARDQFNFTTPAHPIEDALALAASHLQRPVIIGDSGDNPTAGAAQDMATALKAMVDQKITSGLFAVIADAAAYAVCEKSKSGQTVSLSLGRLAAVDPSNPWHVQSKLIKKGRFLYARCALLLIDSIHFIVTDQKVPVHSEQPFTNLGINLCDYQTVVVKSGYLSPAYKSIAAMELLALTPGDTDEILTNLEYKITPRPIYPLDANTKWQPHKENDAT